MTISVMITTRNRCEELRRTVSRLDRLEPAAIEIIICADGCADETVSIITTDFPRVRLLINETAIGSVGSRDRMLRDAKGDWVLSLDDDSYPVTPNFLEKLEPIIASHPEAMVITFPEERDQGMFPSDTKTPQCPGHYVSAYPNCAALMNRDFYLSQPGFPLHFVHMYEEPDFALQCYAGGSAVWFEPSLPIRHHLTPTQRCEIDRHHQNARNELWSVWMRCPWPWLPVVSLFRVWRQFRYACTEGLSWAVREPVWWWSGLLGFRACVRKRHPVKWHIYVAWMKLARHPIQTRTKLCQKFNS